MSSRLQNKMYQYEVTPPEGVWERIIPELDDAALENKFPTLLKNMAVTPAANAWQNIVIALDESLLIDDYSAKLSALAVTPPTTMWEKITNELDGAIETVVPERRRIAPFLRYAVAASIIGLLTWGAFQLFSNKTKESTPLVKESLPVKGTEINPNNQMTIITDNGNAVVDIKTSLEEAQNDAALEASKRTYASLDLKKAKSKIKNAADFYFVPEIDEPGVRSLGNWKPATYSNDLSSRYFTLMTPEGNIIRISKKLSDIVGCVAGAEQDKECLDQLKKWQQKMANPRANHSSGNLLEILNMANSL